MRFVLSREQIRRFDRLAIETCRIPGILLMENAGRGAADYILGLGKAGSYLIICGTGNNGGDGFVVARHLAAQGKSVSVYLVGDAGQIHGDAQINYDALWGCGMTTIPSTALKEIPEGTGLIVDALFGTGLSRKVEGEAARIIVLMNGAAVTKVALDIPSGLDADTGAVLGVAVKADHTVTFAYAKCGELTPAGYDHCGKIHAVNLGVPETILQDAGVTAEIISGEAVMSALPPRSAQTYKHKAGDILIVAGSPGKAGAAYLTAEAAMRSGAGLVTLMTWPEVSPALAEGLPEIMHAVIDRKNTEESLSLALARKSALAVGPGLGLDENAGQLLRHVLEKAQAPVVLDADALTHIAKDAASLKKYQATRILTPHAGELARLLRTTSAAVENDRYGAVTRAAELTDSVVVLKGAHTLVSDRGKSLRVLGEVYPALATAGSGDVLTGIIAAFAAAMPAFEAASAGVYLHSAAAGAWQEKTGSDRGMLAGDIIREIPGVLMR